MIGLGAPIRLAIATLLMLIFTGCSTLNLGTAPEVRNLDYLNDDVASVVLALDVPVSLVPIPGQTQFRYAATLSDGDGLDVRVPLIRADAADLVASLPPPAQGRGYFLFEFAETDKAVLRQLQQQVRFSTQQQNGRGGQITISVEIQICALAVVEPEQTSLSILVALPGVQNLAPLIKDVSLAQFLRLSSQSQLTTCTNAVQ